jgi:hypothetical protein
MGGRERVAERKDELVPVPEPEATDFGERRDRAEREARRVRGVTGGRGDSGNAGCAERPERLECAETARVRGPRMVGGGVRGKFVAVELPGTELPSLG